MRSSLSDEAARPNSCASGSPDQRSVDVDGPLRDKIRRRSLAHALLAPKVSPQALGVSISDFGVVATLVRAPSTMIGLYRASPRYLQFLGLQLTLQDAVTQLQSTNGAPICLVASPEFTELSEELAGPLARRVNVIRSVDLPTADMVASRKLGRALDGRTDAAAIAAARYALDNVVDLTHKRSGSDRTVAVRIDQ